MEGKKVRLFINPHSGTPVYRQLVDQLKRGVRGGILKPGEQLPTVRELALELTINPNTAARAYRELEAEGIITSIQGKGSFIAEEISFPQSRSEEHTSELQSRPHLVCRLLLEKKKKKIKRKQKNNM